MPELVDLGEMRGQPEASIGGTAATGPVDPEAVDAPSAHAALEALAAALDPQEHVTALITGAGRRCRLTVLGRRLGLAEDIYADAESYWWRWEAERIAPVTDPVAAARLVRGRLRTIPETSMVSPVRQEGSSSARFDASVAQPARVYAYWLGGKDHFPADRHAAKNVIARRPEVVTGALANRAFLGRLVRYLAAERGVRQFLDVGTGLPAPDNTHELAQDVDPACRVVYVDNDPVVLAHARALLTSEPEGACDYIDADVREPAAIAARAADTLDFARPVAVLLLAVLHFVADADDPAGIVASLARALPPGSVIAISHLTADFAPAQVAAGAHAYRALVSGPLVPRTHAQVTGLFGGLPLVPPGVVPVTGWRPAVSGSLPPPADLYAGLARVPGERT